jgi:putative transposase
VASVEHDGHLDALEDALRKGRPEIFNTDQGAQFTSVAFTDRLETVGVRISMDGRGRWLDNVFVERLWRSLKYEEVHLKAYVNGLEARIAIGQWLRFYNERRPHQALGYKTPAEGIGTGEFVRLAEILAAPFECLFAEHSASVALHGGIMCGE